MKKLSQIKKLFTHKCVFDANCFYDKDDIGCVVGGFLKKEEIIKISRVFYCKKCGKVIKVKELDRITL